MRRTATVIKPVKRQNGEVIRKGTKVEIDKVGFSGLFARVGSELEYFFNDEVRRDG